MRTTGPELFARYAYPPNELGYCGPGDPQGLLVRGSPQASAEIARRARRVRGCLGVPGADRTGERASPTRSTSGSSRRTGSATTCSTRSTAIGSWTSFGCGSAASPEVSGPAESRMCRRRWCPTTRSTCSRSIPGSVCSTGTVTCRGQFSTSVASGPGSSRPSTDLSAAVRVKPLIWDGARLDIGPPETINVRWSDNGRSMLDGVNVGDTGLRALGLGV